MAEVDERLDRGGLALEHDLDGPVAAVSYPARDPAFHGHPACGIAEEDPLDAAMYDYALSNPAHGELPAAAAPLLVVVVVVAGGLGGEPAAVQLVG